MERLLLYILLLLVGYAHAQDLGELRWQNRVILLFGDAKTEGYLEQNRLFENNQKALDDRDVLIWKGTDQIRKELQLHKDFKGIVLVGKDGSVKLKKRFTVRPKTIWARIDGMPMRRAELAKRKH